MSNYSQNVFFAPKDSLTTGDANKRIKGSEIDAELQEISDAIATKVEDGGVPSGAKMIFIETAAPTGWTLVTGYDDKTIILADSPTDDDTPDTGGSWTISGLTVNISHSHTYSGTTGTSNNNTAGDGSASVSWATNLHTHSYSGTTSTNSAVKSISAGSSWRPAYVESIVCSKD